MKTWLGFAVIMFFLSFMSAQAQTALPDKKAGNDEEISKQVSEIIKMQKTILEQLEEIKKEVEIVKIRATIWMDQVKKISTQNNNKEITMENVENKEVNP